MVAKLAQPVPPMRDMNPNVAVPESYELLCRHLLARNATDRPTHDQLFASLGMIEEEVFGTSQSTRRPAGFAPTGSGPSLLPRGVSPISGGFTPPPADPRDLLMSGDRSKVPHTMIAPISAISGITEGPVAAPSGISRAPSRVPLAIAILLPAILVAAGVVWFLALRPHPTSTTLVTSTSQSVAAPDPPQATSFTLHIDSTPPGATVYEGDGVLGTTPLQITVDRAATATHPRTFVLKKEGFADSTLVQGSSNETVRSTVTLAPDPPATTKARPKGTSVPVQQATAKPVATPAPTGLDIKVKR
ncbi:MAG: PEGA domain-containing protein [Rubrivivax sp.]